ncbi:exopolysaccharide Pel transporter PelG [Legionella sainthelensi]|uniref:Histidine kinase n=1 Tax=Legionella sainthelensi TaxID=28087 RepID=A0A2H5FJF3_9GAMM|nr:exopolysaccharide Pel transporter PelG [Legionella sainthelensi]AUH71670.1 histidine kinase [Legionella sainthelensi]
MAGIGFSLRKILNHESITRTIAAYTVAGVIGGGPWLISILGIISLSIIIARIPAQQEAITQFQISITYLIAGSLIFSSSAGNSFSRYAADQLFLNRSTYLISNLNGLILIISLGAGIFSFFFVLLFFSQQDIAYRLLIMGSFVVLSNIWAVITLLTAVKDYTIILKAFLLSYSIIVLLAYGLRNYGLDAFMFSFLVGQTVLLLNLLIVLYKEYPTNSIIDFHFLKKNSMYKILIFNGLFFNLGVWVDKFIFWYNDNTSYAVIGPFRASLIYDLPIFIAYLCLLPGMAVFLLLIETNFSDYYLRFNEAIRSGKSLSYIKITGNQVATYAFELIYSIVKIQALVIILMLQFGEKILAFLNISLLYYNLLYVAVIGTSLQIFLLAIIDILYYMDRRWYVFVVSISYFVLNLVFSLISVSLGPFYYGYGFTGSLACVCVLGMYFLNEGFNDLEYKVIMLRG